MKNNFLINNETKDIQNNNKDKKMSGGLNSYLPNSNSSLRMKASSPERVGSPNNFDIMQSGLQNSNMNVMKRNTSNKDILIKNINKNGKVSKKMASQLRTYEHAIKSPIN